QGINMKDKEAVKQAYIELVEKEKLEKPVVVRKETEQELLLDIRNLLKQTNIKQPEPATVNPDIKKPIKRSNTKKQAPIIK
ncbi:MAG: hypothetical protein RR334_02530, partial [Clostridia bacterium]